MATLLIVAGVFGMLCYVAWWNWEHSTITLTMVDPPVVLRRGEWVIVSEPTYSAADDLQLKIKVEGE